jgi:hypothetical protein
MSNSIQFQIKSEEQGIVVTVVSNGLYSPDILEDMKRRAIDALRDGIHAIEVDSQYDEDDDNGIDNIRIDIE